MSTCIDAIEETLDTVLSVDPTVNQEIHFYGSDGTEIIRISANGKFYVHGKEVIQDMEIYKAMVRFFIDAGMYRAEYPLNLNDIMETINDLSS